MHLEFSQVMVIYIHIYDVQVRFSQVGIVLEIQSGNIHILSSSDLASTLASGEAELVIISPFPATQTPSKVV